MLFSQLLNGAMTWVMTPKIVLILLLIAKKHLRKIWWDRGEVIVLRELDKRLILAKARGEPFGLAFVLAFFDKLV